MCLTVLFHHFPREQYKHLDVNLWMEENVCVCGMCFWSCILWCRHEYEVWRLIMCTYVNVQQLKSENFTCSHTHTLFLKTLTFPVWTYSLTLSGMTLFTIMIAQYFFVWMHMCMQRLQVKRTVPHVWIDDGAMKHHFINRYTSVDCRTVEQMLNFIFPILTVITD